MKALIIDDEKHVRDAVRLLVDWTRFGVTSIHEAKDGEEGIELIKAHRPELIFTDMMMPNVDGAGVMEWAAQHAPASKLIVISGHDDFKLVRNAITYGSIDYILKPIEPAQLNAAISKATEELRLEEQEKNRSRTLAMELNRLKPMYVEQFFCSVLNEPGVHAVMSDAIRRELKLPSPVRNARVAVVSLELSSPVIRDKFAASGPDLMFFALTNICNEILAERGAGYAFRYWGKEQELVIVFWEEGEQAPDTLAAINAAIAATLKTRFVFGLSASAPFPASASLAYEEAKQALLRRNVLAPAADYVALDEAPAKPANTLLSFHEFEEQIRFAVQGGSRDHIERALHSWFAHIERSGFISFEQLTLWQSHFELSKTLWEYREAQAGGQEESEPHPSDEPRLRQTFRIPVTPEGRFDFEAWKSAVVEETKAVAGRIASRDKERGVIREIAKFLEQRASEDITLQDVANHFYLSREYISRKFKQEMKENISDYIAGIRMNRAKELLGNRGLKISQIAEQVGFQDEKYFSKVFKKWTGCTPNDYRKAHYGE
ncbi:response regulator [Paenibacillus nanensis]|uniref:Response regulator n=1 Tax=Paenibacillus nanensis TaxID=393251 RepID=A0A3A1V0Y1_9BACL|nr:response regulator [Paenibacillus nanensis]RIX51200.1 response regulator [Paenibacillus nanensis]